MKANCKNFLFLFLLLYTTPIIARSEDPQDLNNYCRSQNIRYIEYMFTDFLGNTRSLVRPAEYVEHDLTDGLPFDGSSIPGGTRIVESDMVLMPDLESMTHVPWTNGATKKVRLNCTMYKDKDVPYVNGPRYILQKIMNEAHAMGYEFYVGPELEFYIFNTQKQRPVAYDGASYFSTAVNYQDDLARTNLLHVLRASGIEVEKIHHEVGKGQFEMSIRYGTPVKMADALVVAKQTLKSLDTDGSIKTTFMPKPFANQNGSGMHIHFSLFDIDKKQNAFYSESDPNRLSSVAQSFIAGVLHHARALTLLFNSSVNSFKRLVPGYEAPIFVCCGTKNRSALIRLPHVIKDRPEAVRAEIRSPDPLCNPYLAFAGLLAAGLDGIKNNMQLPEIITQNLYNFTANQVTQAGIETLPKTLEEALMCYKESTLLKNLMGQKLFQDYFEAKIQEITDFSRCITDWEYGQYF